MPNPGEFAAFGDSLAAAGEKVTQDIGKAFVDLNVKIIEDPNVIVSAKKTYAKQVQASISVWDESWKDWADKDLADAYHAGTQSATADIKAMGNMISNTKGVQQPQSPTAHVKAFSNPLLINAASTVAQSAISGAVAELFETPAHLNSYTAFRNAAYNSLEDTSFNLFRTANDMYRDVAVQAGENFFKEADIFTRRKYSEDMLKRYAEKGIQSVTYKNGRKMSIEAYSEMVGRTTSSRVALQANLNKCAEAGYDLVKITSHFRTCDMCAPFEGAVLSVSGKDKRHRSLRSATAAGLFHPNCLHDMNPYHQGVTPDVPAPLDPAEKALVDEYGYADAQKMAYKAQQKQRYLERKIRVAKRKEIVALDKAAKREAKQAVMALQVKQRALIQENAFLKRDYVRESVKGYKAAAGPAGKAAASKAAAEAAELAARKAAQEAAEKLARETAEKAAQEAAEAAAKKAAALAAKEAAEKAAREAAEKLTTKGKIAEIQKRVASYGGVPDEDDIKKAGKIIMDDLKAKRNAVSSKIDDLQKGPIAIKRAELYKKAKELRKSKAAYSEIKAVYGEIDNIDKELHSLQIAYRGTTKRNADELKSVLSEVRAMGVKDAEKTSRHLIASTSDKEIKEVLKDAYNYYPTSWTEKSIQANRIKVSQSSRGYYRHGAYESEINISGPSYESKFETAIHELGHRFEKTTPYMRDYEAGFYEARTVGEKSEWMGGVYAKDEIAKKDKFINAYMGKDYGTGEEYELISMGFQDVYTKPTELWKDEDYASWIYGILTLVP